MGQVGPLRTAPSRSGFAPRRSTSASLTRHYGSGWRRDGRRLRARQCDSRVAVSPVAHRSTTCRTSWLASRRAGYVAVGWSSRAAATNVAECPSTSAIGTGPTASAPNALRISVAEMNEAVLQAIEAHALTPEAIEHVIQLSEQDDVVDQRATLERERADVEKRIANITKALEIEWRCGIAGRQGSANWRNACGPSTARSPAFGPSHDLHRTVIENRLAEWRRLLRASTTQGRTVLQRVLRGRLTFTPRADGDAGYDFTAPTRFDRLFAGIVAPSHPRCARHTAAQTAWKHLRPEDTFDADYGRLLENARRIRKGSCARRDSNPRPTGSKPAALSS